MHAWLLFIFPAMTLSRLLLALLIGLAPALAHAAPPANPAQAFIDHTVLTIALWALGVLVFLGLGVIANKWWLKQLKKTTVPN